MLKQKIRFWGLRLLADHPSAFLLGAQLLSLILYAAFEGATTGRVLISIGGVLVLLFAVWIVVRSPATNWIALLLVGLTALFSLLAWVLSMPGLLVWAGLLEAVMYFYAAGSLSAKMMADRQVTFDELFAAAATWTLIAWGFGYLYLVCQAWVPGSFTGAGAPEQPLSFIELLFVSFTNLSSTGLSDIVPVSPVARAVAMVEQFSGVIYLAMIVSRLVGMTLTPSGHGRAR